MQLDVSECALWYLDVSVITQEKYDGSPIFRLLAAELICLSVGTAPSSNASLSFEEVVKVFEKAVAYQNEGAVLSIIAVIGVITIADDSSPANSSTLLH